MAIVLSIADASGSRSLTCLYESAGLESPDRCSSLPRSDDVARRAHRRPPFDLEVMMSILRKVVIIGAVTSALLSTTSPADAKDDRHSPGDPYPVPVRALLGEVCQDDTFCSSE